MIFVFTLALFASTTIAYTNGQYITLFGDVHKDAEFFTRTYPWIIDNIGADLYVEYYMLGSGRYSVPQACALRNMYGNSFLQAQYLRCEAKGYPSEYCLCETAIDREQFKQCVATGGYLAGVASERWSALGVNISPIFDLAANNTVYGLDDISLLKKICTIYGDNLPRGCIHYSNQTEGFLEQKALAQFDRACENEFPIPIDKLEPTTTTERITPEPWVTQTTPTTRMNGTQPDWWSTTTTEGVTRPTDGTTTSPPWPTTSTRLFTTSPPWWFTTPPAA